MRKVAPASSLAVLTGLLYIGSVVFGLAAPSPFSFLFDAQFLGAAV